MKMNLQKNLILAPLLLAGTLLAVMPAQAVNYAGNGNTSFGGPVGNGTLSVTDDGTNITVNLQRGVSGNLNDALVIYIDTGAGGYANTASLADTSGYEQKAISGYDGSNRSLMVFTNGFRPSYAIAIKSDYVDSWNLSNPSGFSFIDGAGGYNSSSANFSLTFPAAHIGLAANVSANIRLFGTLLNPNGAYRSIEAIAGNDLASSFGQGPYPFTNTAFATYTFAGPAAPTNLVTFAVDMTAQIQSSAFNPGNGDAVYVGGSFESTPFAFNLHLTNNPNAANTNIYTGTYPDQNSTNTVEQYKFKFYSIANAGDTYDADPNRRFTLQSNGQQVPLIYFNNIPANPSATTNTITFQIDMGPQVFLGHFNPGAGDLIEIFGGFQTPQFSGGLILTNNPNAANTNIYSGQFADHNYPGTQYLPSQNGYKYAVVTSANTTNYESIVNRSLVTPTNSGTLPLAYFNNVFSIYSNAVTFQVDMTVPLLTGALNPGNGDTVSAAGTFQTNIWTPGSFVLTNNPSGANPNLYSGTYVDYDAPGTGELYKFVILSSGSTVTNYENIANRTFVLDSTPQTLPPVIWNNQNTNNVQLVPTQITFTVNMTNAVDDFGYAFDPSADAVVINGDFLKPQWPDFWTDNLLGGFDYTANVLQNNGQNLLYTGTFIVPAGNSLQVQYKYGIIHGYTGTGNTNCDNEAPFGDNHTRWIRSTGTYNFPTDIFGIQRTNLPAATEPSFGNLAIGSPAAGNLSINWLGRPGVHLQYTTNLTRGVWVDLNATDGTNSYTATQTNATGFFRLVNP